MNKFLINCFDFSDFIKLGNIRIKTEIKKIVSELESIKDEERIAIRTEKFSNMGN